MQDTRGYAAVLDDGRRGGSPMCEKASASADWQIIGRKVRLSLSSHRRSPKTSALTSTPISVLLTAQPVYLITSWVSILWNIESHKSRDGFGVYHLLMPRST